MRRRTAKDRTATAGRITAVAVANVVPTTAAWCGTGCATALWSCRLLASRPRSWRRPPPVPRGGAILSWRLLWRWRLWRRRVVRSSSFAVTYFFGLAQALLMPQGCFVVFSGACALAAFFAFTVRSPPRAARRYLEDPALEPASTRA